MSDELKPVLTKVLASQGKKRFFFGYALGKRKDGKGDGELAVRTKKPKKAEIETALSDCKEVFEGYCWTGNGPENGETVYFQAKGKKLSMLIVTKMALTAKKITNRQYDFQLPSPEEEARAELLASEGSEEESSDPSAGTVPKTSSEAKTPANLQATYQTRVAALTGDLKKALTSATPAGNEAKLRFAESQTCAKNLDFPQALVLLDVVEERIKQALAGTDPAAEYKAKLAEWTPVIKAAMAAKGPTVADIAKLLAQATALSRPGGDLVQALAKLTECHALAAGNAPRPGANADEARWLERREAIEAPYLNALKDQPASASRLRAALAAADGKADLGQFGPALEILARLETLLHAPAQTSAEAAAALQQWQAACAEVKSRLRKVQTEIVNAKDSNSAKAVMRLESIVKYLAFQPSTQDDVLELERWIGDDEVIAMLDVPNALGVEVKLRATLLPVLADLKPRLTA